MEQAELDEYWAVFETLVKPLSEREQRKIAYRYCLLVENDLDDLGKTALKLVEELTTKHVSLRKCESLTKKLQNKLQGTSPYSVLIWALVPNTDGFPVWYSTGIAGLNIVDLNLATLPELTTLTKETLNAL